MNKTKISLIASALLLVLACGCQDGGPVEPEINETDSEFDMLTPAYYTVSTPTVRRNIIPPSICTSETVKPTSPSMPPTVAVSPP